MTRREFGFSRDAGEGKAPASADTMRFSLSRSDPPGWLADRRRHPPYAARYKEDTAIRPVDSTNQRSLLNDLPASRATSQSATRVGGNGPRLAAGTLPTE